MCEQLYRHVLEIAHRFDVRLVMDTALTDDPKSSKESARGIVTCNPDLQPIAREVRCPFVVDLKTYAIALHELGHMIAPNGNLWPQMDEQGKIPTLRNVRMILEQEESAWEWARANALTWTDDMTTFQQQMFATYKEYCDVMRQGLEFVALLDNLRKQIGDHNGLTDRR